MERGTQPVLSRRRFDVDEYHRMDRAGILQEDDPIQPLDGELIEVPAVSSPHISCIGRLNRLMVLGLSGRAFVTVQSPVRLDRYSEPEPDIAILRPRDDDYADATPTPEDTHLVIEVAASSLPLDKGVKLPLYARAGISEFWIVDLRADTIEVYRQPRAETFAECHEMTEGRIACLAFPDLAPDVRDILPPRT